MTAPLAPPTPAQLHTQLLKQLRQTPLIYKMESIPKTPEGDALFLEAVKLQGHCDVRYFRYLEKEALKRPRIYEELMAFLNRRNLEIMRWI